MKDLLNKQLTIKISSEVISTNIDEFEKDALAILDGIKTILETDQDFAEAKQNVKDIQTVETRIENEKQKAIMSQESIEKLMTTTDRIIAKFRDTRLLLNRTVKDEEERRKKEIVNAGIVMVSDKLKGSVVKHALSVGVDQIRATIKGKRSLEKMEEAVLEEATNQLFAIREMEENFCENILAIELAEKEFPGLFPDWSRLAINPVENVNLNIQARVEKHKNDLRERAEAAKKAAEEKAERERIAVERKAEQDRIAAEKAEAERIAEQETETVVNERAETISSDIKKEVDVKKFFDIPSNPFTDPPRFNDTLPPPFDIQLPKGTKRSEVGIKDIIEVYNAGYSAGHNDTVESVFIDIHYTDVRSYHDEEVEELLNEMGIKLND